MTIHAVLIHEQPNLRRLLADLLRGYTKHRVEVDEAGYDIRLPGVWQRWIDDADVFILGLERRYEGGIRAEGITVAEELARQGKRVLVVGSEANGALLPTALYWDIGSDCSFLEAVGRILENPVASVDDFLALREFFGERLEVPTGH